MEVVLTEHPKEAFKSTNRSVFRAEISVPYSLIDLVKSNEIARNGILDLFEQQIVYLVKERAWNVGRAHGEAWCRHSTIAAALAVVDDRLLQDQQAFGKVLAAELRRRMDGLLSQGPPPSLAGA